MLRLTCFLLITTFNYCTLHTMVQPSLFIRVGDYPHTALCKNNTESPYPIMTVDDFKNTDYALVPENCFASISAGQVAATGNCYPCIGAIVSNGQKSTLSHLTYRTKQNDAVSKLYEKFNCLDAKKIRILLFSYKMNKDTYKLSMPNDIGFLKLHDNLSQKEHMQRIADTFKEKFAIQNSQIYVDLYKIKKQAFYYLATDHTGNAYSVLHEIGNFDPQIFVIKNIKNFSLPKEKFYYTPQSIRQLLNVRKIPNEYNVAPLLEITTEQEKSALNQN